MSAFKDWLNKRGHQIDEMNTPVSVLQSILGQVNPNATLSSILTTALQKNKTFYNDIKTVYDSYNKPQQMQQNQAQTTPQAPTPATPNFAAPTNMGY